MNSNQLILTVLFVVTVLFITIKISIERTKDRIFDNSICRQIIIDTILSEIEVLPHDLYTINYRIYVGTINAKLNNKLDRRVLLYYENNKDFINNTIIKIVNNRGI